MLCRYCSEEGYYFKCEVCCVEKKTCCDLDFNCEECEAICCKDCESDLVDEHCLICVDH